jgi:exosortase/archaeosortase family protein
MTATAGSRLNSRRSARGGTLDGPAARRIPITPAFAAAVSTLLAVRSAKAVRHVEAAVATRLIRHSGVGRAFWMHGDRFVLAVRHPQIITIAPACSALFLCLPLVVVGTFLATGGTARATNATLATAVGCAALFAVNQLRFLAIAICVKLLGEQTGFQFGHLLLGTALSLVGIAVVAFCMVAVVQRTRRRVRAE